MLLVRQNATASSLRNDWVAPHEFSHLSHPFVARSDLWFSEGIATYYQEVLRARVGLQSELEAWRALDAGFRRGRGGGTGRTLREESRDVMRTRAFRHVYWGGAAIAFRYDVALRRQGKSLDDALASLASRPGLQLQPWSGKVLAEALDAAVGVSALGPLLPGALDATELSEMDDTYGFLGLRRSANGELAGLSDDAPGAPVRTAIMRSVLRP